MSTGGIVLVKRKPSEADIAPEGKVRLFIDDEGRLAAKDEHGTIVIPQALIASLEAVVATKQDASTAATDAELASAVATINAALSAEEAARKSADATLLPKAGGTMTGALTLSGDPTNALHAATRQFVLAQIAALVNGAPEALDTLKEISDALKAAEASDKSALEALTALVETKLSKAANLGDVANAATARTNLGLDTAATHAATDFDPAGSAAAAQAASQPLDADLTAIAALSTQGFGRGLLTAADAAAARSSLGLGSAATQPSTAFDAAGAAAAEETRAKAAEATKLAKSEVVALGGASGEALSADQVAAPGADYDILIASGGTWAKLAKGDLGEALVVRSDGTVKYERLPYIDVRWCGAKWDGVTDDHAAVQEAVTKSTERNFIPILLPEGTGVFKGTVTIPKNLAQQIKIVGQGKRRTTIKLEGVLQAFGFAATVPGDTVGNIDISDFTVDGNEEQVPEPAVQTPVILGTTSTSQERVNILNVRAERLRAINVPTLEERHNGRRCIILQVKHAEPGLAKNEISNIEIHDIETTGQAGIIIYGVTSGSGPKPINVYLGHIHVSDIRYTGQSVAEAFGFSAGFQIGQYAWSDGKDITIERIYSENSADVGVEIDVPCTARDIECVNANDSNLLLNTFNPTTTAEPIVAKLTAKAAVGATTLSVSSTAGFVVGEQIVLYASTVAKCSTRTIKAIGEGTIELTEALGLEHASGTWLSQVDVAGGKMLVENFKSVRTAATPGGNRGLAIQNVENPIPAPAMEVNGYTYRRTYEGVFTNQGEIVLAQFGTATSKAGNPRSLRIRRVTAELPHIALAAAEKHSFVPFYLSLGGVQFPFELQGEVNVAGAGVTGGGQLPTQLVKVFGSALYDIDLLCSLNLGSTGGEAARMLTLNEESKSGDLAGRARVRVRKSSIASGGGSLSAIRYGKGNGFASSSITTTTTAKTEIGATKLPVASVTNFAAGDAIVLDSGSSAAEIFVVKEISGSELVVVSVGESPGAAAEHASGVQVSRLNLNTVVDSDFSGLGSEATPILNEDEKTRMRLLVKGTRYPKAPGIVVLAIPASTKAFQILQPGQSGIVFVEGGAVSAIEWSANGSTFWKLAAGTGFSFHVSPGDFVKLTYSSAPTVKFQADRT